MRHRKDNRKLGRTSGHREAMLGSLVSHLILQRRIRTTISKAKEARRLADKMVTLGREGTVAARRNAQSKLRNPDAVKALFADIAPATGERPGGYTRIIKIGRRSSDSSEMVYLEWVDAAPIVKAEPAEA